MTPTDPHVAGELYSVSAGPAPVSMLGLAPVCCRACVASVLAACWHCSYMVPVDTPASESAGVASSGNPKHNNGATTRNSTRCIRSTPTTGCAPCCRHCAACACALQLRDFCDWAISRRRRCRRYRREAVPVRGGVAVLNAYMLHRWR